jgi:hypothetical protein
MFSATSILLFVVHLPCELAESRYKLLLFQNFRHRKFNEMVFPAREIQQFGANEKCIFCRGNTVDEFRLGKVYKYKNLIVHYYCLVNKCITEALRPRCTQFRTLFRNTIFYLQLFASHLQQNGSDKQGILGFLICDIEKELGNKSNSVRKKKTFRNSTIYVLRLGQRLYENIRLFSRFVPTVESSVRHRGALEKVVK